jgi:DEAD/DEAH box helicase domain-containing protein
MTSSPTELRTRALWLDPRGPSGPTALGAWRAEWVDGVARAGYALEHVAALLVLGEGGDLGRALGAAGADRVGRIILYDTWPGGSGVAQRLYQARVELTARAVRLVASCACRRGCPGCIGPVPDLVDEPASGPTAKQAALGILRSLLADLADAPAPGAAAGGGPP